MNKTKRTLLSLLTLGALMPLQAQVHKPSPADTPASQMEKLDRGLVAIPKGNGNYFLSWRLLGTDTPSTTFVLLRDGQPVSGNLFRSTNATVTGSADSRFQVVTLQDGVPVDTSAVVLPWTTGYLRLKLNRPAAGTNASGSYTYSPNDCTVADVDGDGKYEIIVKWDPSNSKDNSQKGYTGNVYLDCYRLDGSQLWRIDLGRNIRAGAHYTQFLVYDFDGDGRAEVICKTAPGSLDGTSRYVTEAGDATIRSHSNTTDYRNSNGYVLTGPEYLTVFSGLDGHAIHTIWYCPDRGMNISPDKSASYSSGWGDSYGNRGDRFLSAVAYLGGKDEHPSAVFCRGYYTQAFVWAVDFDGTTLKQRWLHSSTSASIYNVRVWNANTGAWNTKTRQAPANTSGKGNKKTLYGNGNHNLSVADVDGDGCDEIIYGSAALDQDGFLLYATGYGHGDAMHVADIDPDRPGYEVFDVHEEDTDPYGMDLHDAATGEILFNKTGSEDNGRGLCADVIPDAVNRGAEFWSSNYRDLYNVHGTVASTKHASVNFRIYWDGTAQDNLLDGTVLTAWNGNGFSTLRDFSGNGSSQSCNSTKKTPNLQADIFGDWREEVILWDGSDGATLNIFSTTTESPYRVPTLMHDHVYRLGITWQQAAYNQPPHLGYYLPDYIDSFQGIDPSTGIEEVSDARQGSAVLSRSYFTANGVQVSRQHLVPGLYIVRTQYANGTSRVQKIMIP